MSKIVPQVPPGDYELPPIVGAHNGLILVSSLAFALLFAERSLYEHLSAPRLSGSDATLIVALSALVVFAGMLASFVLPPIIMPEGDQSRWIPHTMNFLFGEGAISLVCVGVSFTVAVLLQMLLAAGDLGRIAWLLRDGFMYLALATIIYHGYVTFVRYLGFLYQTGGADKTKVIAFQVSALTLLLVIGLYQYTVDLIQILRAGPGQGLLVLHLTVRDIWLAIMVGIIVIWQLGRAGDH